MSDNKLFNKQILATIEENDDYTMIETFFIDSKKFPSMYEAMTECFRIFWTPYSYKDKVLMEEIRKKRIDYFGENHIRASYCSLGDLIMHIAERLKKEFPGTLKEDHINVMLKNMNFYGENKNIHDKRAVAKLISANAYYFDNPNPDEPELYSMLGIPRSKEEHRLTIESIVKQYIYLKGQGRL